MRNRQKMLFHLHVGRYYSEQVRSILSFTIIFLTFAFVTEGRRYGKTVIIAKNLRTGKLEEENEDDDSEDDDESESESQSDDSMEGHPPKKQKIS